MAYGPSTNFGGAAKSDPSGKALAGSSTFSNKAGSAGAKSEPSGGMKGGGMTTKGNAKKL